MIDRAGLIEAFKDTQRMVKENRKLAELTLKMQAGTCLYLDRFEAVDPHVKTDVPDISVIEDTTFHAAKTYCLHETVTDKTAEVIAAGAEKTAVLNFANAYTPGGGVEYGAMAQEECLCRSSNLYRALTLPYLLRHYYKWNSQNTGDMGSDAIIYSPGVTVFKSDDMIPRLLPQWFRTDVLTCAAPYFNPDKKKPVTPERLEEVFHGRIRNILEVAAAQDVDILVLGAFGCGAFNNPPDLVAGVFADLLLKRGYGRFFKKVIFAIKRNNVQNTNLEAFRRAFQNN